jgi:inner membrane protein
MDPFTHGLVGALASQTVSKKKFIRPAAFAGFGAALLADLDSFISSSSDPLLNIELHRQFSHSLVFIPVGALVATALLWYFLRNQLSPKQIYMYSFSGYATHWFLDTCTSYGTVLFWPVSDVRYSWNLISVVDPLFTLILAVLAGIGVYYQKKPWVFAAWVWLVFYLISGWIQHHRGETAAEKTAIDRGHQIERMVVKPTIGNQILWRATYEFDGRFYTDGIRLGYFSDPIIYEGDSAKKVIPGDRYSVYNNTLLYHDIKRMERFSDGYLIQHPGQKNIIGDARYSMLPTSMIPLWGVRVDTTRPNQHLPFLYFRDAGEEIRNDFTKMLLGKPVQ